MDVDKCCTIGQTVRQRMSYPSQEFLQGGPVQLVPFLPSLPFLPAIVSTSIPPLSTPNPYRSLGERYKCPQLGPEQSPSRKHI